VNYAPIGAHGWWCDEGDLTRMCDECKTEATWDDIEHTVDNLGPQTPESEKS